MGGQGRRLRDQWSRRVVCPPSVRQLFRGRGVASVRDGANAAWFRLADSLIMSGMSIRASWGPGEVRVAVTDETGLLDYRLWRPGAPDGVGDVYRGRISTIMPAMAGAFVTLSGGSRGGGGGAGRGF